MLVRVIGLACAIFTLSATAGGQFVYFQVESSGDYRSLAPGEVDLTYPAPGAPTPMIDVSKGERNEGIPMSGHAGRHPSRGHVIIGFQPHEDERS